MTAAGATRLPTTFYKYLDLQGAMLVINGCSLRWSSPLRFNDPFDVPREVDLGFLATELMQAVCEEHVQAILGTSGLINKQFAEIRADIQRVGSPEFTEATIAAFREDARAPEIAARWLAQLKEYWRVSLRRTRILCLSATNRSLPMWAHYADSHRGIVLEFAVTDEPDNPFSRAQQVAYQTAPATLPPIETWAREIAGGEEVDLRGFFREYHFVKSPQWSYEEEWRLWEYRAGDESPLSHWTFRPRDLVSVYIGADVSDDREVAVRRALRSDFAHVRLFRAVADHVARQLVFHPLR